MQAQQALAVPFFIEKQESLATEKVSKNGRTMDLHYVAKNIAFTIYVAATFDLNQSPISAKLIYDYDNGEQREVETLKNAPLEYLAHVDDSGYKAAVECKLGVLSSQHEGAFFRIKFFAVDPLSNTVLEEYSQPLKVISKRNQVKKQMEKRKSAVATKTEAQTHPSTPPSPAPVSGAVKRAAGSDVAIQDTLQRMEEAQREHFRLLQQLLQKQTEAPQTPQVKDDDFESAFINFLTAYKKLPVEERPNKIRRVLKSMDESATENLSEFVSLSARPTPSTGIIP
jgi:hypothetical protein